MLCNAHEPETEQAVRVRFCRGFVVSFFCAMSFSLCGEKFFLPVFGRLTPKISLQEGTAMLLTNAVNTEGRPLEIYVKDGKIAAVGQDLSALAAENEDGGGCRWADCAARICGSALPLAHPGF